VIFDIDANGILNVTAKDKGTGKEQTITITGASTLDDAEVDRMVKDAEANADADKERRERIDLKNQADSLSYQAEKQLADMGDKVPAADKEKAEGQIKDLRAAVEAEDFDKIKPLTEELQQTLYGISTNLYQQADGDAAAGAPGPEAAAEDGSSGGDDDVIDAEFSEPESK